jgi:hypothetical protein
MKTMILVCVCIVVGTLAAAHDKLTEELLALRDPVVQDEISELFAVRGEREHLRQIERIRESVGDEGEADLVVQLAIYATTASDEREFGVLETLLLLHRLEIPPIVVVRGLAPHLGSENARLRGFARDWFESHEAPADDEPFEAYGSYIYETRHKGLKLPDAFIEFIFERTPGRALLAFNDASKKEGATALLLEMHKKREAQRDSDQKPEVFEFTVEPGKAPPVKRIPPPLENLPAVKGVPGATPRRRDLKRESEVRLTEHLVSNAIWLKKHRYEDQFEKAAVDTIAQLAALAKNEQWWCRLYVAEVMRKHPELRQNDLLKELADDSNEHVRRAAEASLESR